MGKIVDSSAPETGAEGAEVTEVVANETPDTGGDAGAAAETPETPETPAEAKTGEKLPLAGEDPAEETDEPAAKEETPAYQPNLKFKYAVEGKPTAEEREFDERFRGVIKTAEDEKLVRELHEKAYGLDFIKPRFQQTRERLQAADEVIKTQFQPLFLEVQDLGRAVKSNDFDSVLDKLEIPFEKMMQYVADKLKYEELSPAERRQVDDQNALRKRAQYTEISNQSLAQSHNATAVQLRTLQLDLALDKGDTKTVAEAVDAVHGKDAFRKEIIRRGQAYARESNVDRSVDELVQEVANIWRPFLKQGSPASDPASGDGGAASPTAPAASGKSATAARAKPATLPNVEAQASVPIRKEITSLDDLRKLSKEMSQTQLAE